jgi:hypothetical protein
MGSVLNLIPKGHLLNRLKEWGRTLVIKKLVFVFPMSGARHLPA